MEEHFKWMVLQGAEYRYGKYCDASSLACVHPSHC